MSDRTVISTDLAPRPIGPYSQAIKVGGQVFVAGQLGLDAKSMRFAGADAASQTHQAMKNIETILQYAGLTMGHVVRCVLYVANLGDMRAINEAYQKFFLVDPPVRTTVQVAALPGGALIEIEATAVIPERPASKPGLK